MDSEDSRDASSGNESDDKSRHSPASSRSRSRESNARSTRSPSRSSSPPSRRQSASPQSRPLSPDSTPQSPQNGIPSRRSSDAHSAVSRSSSSDGDRSPSRSRPHTPKSGVSFQSGGHAARSRSASVTSDHRSSRSVTPNDQSAAPQTVARSASSKNSSRSSSLDSPPRQPTKTPVSDNDNASVKSASSRSSKKSRSSRISGRSSSTRGSRRSRGKSDDGNSSDSSESSVDSSSRRNRTVIKSADTQPEEISDGDMESDHEKEASAPTENASRPEINISHEDLSDVSDLDDCMGDNSDEEHKEEDKKAQENSTGHLNEKTKSTSPEHKKVVEKNNRAEEGEEQLDFEAEDGECGEIEPSKDKDEAEPERINKEEAPKAKEKEKEELEEGEVTDEDDARPEETEPRPVCRFFSRGQCTWGASCRFLHPGVTDKGNYTMFELIRPVVPGEFGRDERMYGKVEPPLVESAWERGLRTAKEMLRKSVKRKEQDIDFEEKKMNLSLAQEEFDKENGYYGRVPSPEPRYVRHVPVEFPVSRPPEEYYGRRQVLYEPEYAPPPRERVRSYRELPSHRMPDYYNTKYEEEPPTSSKRPRPKREVIVQRVEERQGRGDEWSDPWMRSKSPGRRKESGGRKRSYSSGSSYSSSRSRSRSPHRRRTSGSGRGRQISPSVIVSERKAANERAALMNPPAPKRRAPSPGMMRVSGAANPPAPSREDQFGRSRTKLAVAAAALARAKNRRRSSRSSSGSSGSSSSDSDSSDSSSSSSRTESSPPRRPTGVDLSIAKAMDALKGGSAEKKQIKLNLKTPVGIRKADLSELARKVEPVGGKKRAANSPPPADPKSKKATSRREELLKQLKAVEDAIAKKRSKVN
ncbi:hypothetical protein NQ315_006220 [Exocentrus adspersus]|uniref:C3H1-type domain-containing protein n=1 Tax=Exocentrus adspersus TaxID=1586481 RepID=A0AAV8W0E6_9CUCU|nr:hypothetical protein NQ315_006220 [Exocentrus adspersus]